MHYKVGVFGSAENESDGIIAKARQLGAALADKQCMVITGACSGLPYVAAECAYRGGAEVVGYSPVRNDTAQKQFTPNDDISIYKTIHYIPDDFTFKDNINVCKKYRNVISTANCNAGIIISGRWGTLNEFTNLFDMGKVIGVLTDTSGIANELPHLTKKIHKQSSAKIIFDDDPQNLVEQIIVAISESI